MTNSISFGGRQLRLRTDVPIFVSLLECCFGEPSHKPPSSLNLNPPTGDMDIVCSLYAEVETLLQRVETELVENNNQRDELMRKLRDIKLMLSSAMDQLREIGNFGVVDKQLEMEIKSGLKEMQCLVYETWKLYHGGACVNFNCLLKRFVGIDRNKKPLRKLAKKALEALPSFDDPQFQGRHFVEKEASADTVLERVNHKHDILGLVLSQDSQPSLVSIVPILGSPGSGKTSLARLVYINAQVQHSFDIKLWVDISNLSSPLNILHEFTRIVEHEIYLHNIDDESFLETKLRNKNYLLVLDNLLEKDGGEWFKLLDPLLSISSNCKHGCIILVTSRSTSINPHSLAQLPLAKGTPYLLEPFHSNECLAVFQSIAFERIEKEDNPNLIDIGVQICNKISSNLHVIKIIASVLSSRPADRWQYFSDSLLNSIDNPVESIQSILDLMPALYQFQQKFLTMLFLFPLDFKFTKADLLLLPNWDQNTSLNLKKTQTLFNDIFENLVNIGYFYEDSKDKTSGIVYYKAHIFLYEVVKHLVRHEWSLLDKFTNIFAITQNMSFTIHSSGEVPFWLNHATQFKSLFFFPSKSCKFISIPNINEILVNFKVLTALDLMTVHFKSSPDFIGELKQLRYLRLGISFEYIPDCITNLEHLCTLDLRHTAITKLPLNFYKLRRMVVLYTGRRLVDLPPRFGSMSSLSTLDEFIVGANNGLDEVAKLTHLAGTLNIRYQEGPVKHTLQAKEDFLAGRNLKHLSLTWASSNGSRVQDVHQERDALEFEFLQPPSTLESLAIKGWEGVKFPKWAMDQFSILLKRLCSLKIVDCSRCQCLPSISSLPNLILLRLQGLPALEWVEIPNNDWNAASSSSTKAYFPSLKYLMLANLPQLKGWSKVNQQENMQCLTELKVSDCPMMMSMPLVPSLVMLEVVNVQGKLLKHLLNVQEMPASSSSTSSKLKELHIRSVHELESLTITIPSLQVLAIRECKELANVFVDPSNALKQLHIQACLRIKHVSQAFYNLSVLEELEIDGCEESDWLDTMDDSASRAAWKSLKSLRSLTLINISKPEPFLEGLGYLQTLTELSLCWLYNLSVLPESLEHLTGLTQLVIRNCPNIKRIPEFLPKLKSLKLLQIKECWKLERRCKQPHGEDCHLIEHILPRVYLGELPI